MITKKRGMVYIFYGGVYSPKGVIFLGNNV